MVWGILAFLVGIALMTLLFRIAALSMGRAFGEIVHRRHTDVEFVLNTRKPPPRWRFGPSGRPRSRRAILRNLRTLMGYFRNAPVFESERDRVVLLRDLEQIRQEWRSATREELIGER